MMYTWEKFASLTNRRSDSTCSVFSSLLPLPAFFYGLNMFRYNIIFYRTKYSYFPKYRQILMNLLLQFFLCVPLTVSLPVFFLCCSSELHYLNWMAPVADFEEVLVHAEWCQIQLPTGLSCFPGQF